MKFLLSILLILIFSNPLLAEVKEEIDKNEIFVGDLIRYHIEYNDISNLTIKEGDHFSSEEIPDFRISEIVKDQTSANCIIIFFKTGSYNLPIQWEESGQKVNSTILIEVKPRLTGNESDITEIEPPLYFTGSVGFKIFIIILIVLINLYIIYAILLYIRKRKKIYNASWSELPPLSGEEKTKLLLNRLLSNESIKEKYFYYVITEILKEIYSEKLQMNLRHLTDKEFFSEIQKRTNVNEQELNKIQIYFTKAKYQANENEISSEEGFIVWKNLQTQLKL